jgi:hypothetical protein
VWLALAVPWLPLDATGELRAENGWRALLAERVDAGATVEAEWALGTGTGKSQKLETVVEPELELELPWSLELTTLGRIRVDAFDRLEPGSPTPQEVSSLSRGVLIGNHTDAELREFYVEARLERTYLTVGKQQIVWGKADGLKVLDLVNPQDFREFILEDFEDSRIPLWALNAEVPVGPTTFQLVWLPDPSYHELPEPDSLYAFTSPRLQPPLPPGIPVDVRPLNRPRRLLADSDGGIRVSTFWKGWDLTLNYLYHYRDEPIPFRELPTALGAPITISPSYERTHLLGGTFSNAFGDLTLRGEVAFSTDRFFATMDLNDEDGVVETSELASVLGFDWYGYEETLASFQIFQSWIPSYQSGVLREETDTNLTFLLQRAFLNDSLSLENFWIHGLNEGDGLVRSEIRYELRDDLEVGVGMDLFYGSRDGLFGQFDGNDRVTFRIEWSL